MSPDSVVVIQATPEIRVRASAPQVITTGDVDPGHIVVLAASTVAGPQGPPGKDSNELLLEHINSETPHPVYDDGPDLAILYENAKV